jgi:hypothetical protein
MNKIKSSAVLIFAVGIIIVLLSALMMFCQERCFLGVDLEGWPAVSGIVGIGLIAGSGSIATQYFILKGKKR